MTDRGLRIIFGAFTGLALGTQVRLLGLASWRNAILAGLAVAAAAVALAWIGDWAGLPWKRSFLLTTDTALIVLGTARPAWVQRQIHREVGRYPLGLNGTFALFVIVGRCSY